MDITTIIWIMIGAGAFGLLWGFFGNVKKKDALMVGSGILLVLGILALFVVPSGQPLATNQPGETQPLAAAGLATASCDTNNQGAIQMKIKDTEPSLLAYLAATTYFSYGDEFINATTSTAGYTSQGTTFNCGVPYSVTAVTAADGAASVTDSITIDRALDYKELMSHNIDGLQVRVHDDAADSYLSLYDDGGTSTNQTTFTELNLTNVFADVSATDISVGADGRLEYTISLKTLSSNQFGGDIDQWVTFDIGSDVEWDEPDAAFEGRSLSNQKAQLISTYPESSTGAKIAAADYAYKLGDGKTIGDTAKDFTFSLAARSGQNPDTTNDDVTICFLSAGRYLSNEQSDTIKTGIYTDGSTQSLVTHSATTPCLTINVQ